MANKSSNYHPGNTFPYLEVTRTWSFLEFIGIDVRSLENMDFGVSTNVLMILEIDDSVYWYYLCTFEFTIVHLLGNIWDE